MLFDEKDDRSWEKYDVKFLNDTKRVIQSILTKKITTNSLAGSYASLEAILETPAAVYTWLICLSQRYFT